MKTAICRLRPDSATTAKRDKKAHRAFLYHLNRPALSGYPRFNITVFPDGTIKDAIRLDYGWWERKDVS